MILGLTGYHSVGKSVLTEFLVKKFGWYAVNKRGLLKEWSGVGDDEHQWVEWYHNLYKKMGSYEIMHHLLRRMNYRETLEQVIILDAIHTPEEWRAIKDVDSSSLLVGLFIPKEYRLQRSSPEDLVLDTKRQHYWHAGENHPCLLSQIEWSFCGTANAKLRELEAEHLFEHLTSRKKIKIL